MLFTLSGPSGVGKETILKAFRAMRPEFVVPVSYTTRNPREGETDGVQYNFTTREEFVSLQEKGFFVEWAEVHGNLYGTSFSELERCQGKGDVILEIDCQGARQIKKRFADAVLIFVLPPSMQELRRRLEKRGTETPEAIERRLQNAEKEIESSIDFDYSIIADGVDDEVKTLSGIVDAFLAGKAPRKLDFSYPSVVKHLLATAPGRA
jgi:guanylate kinase